MNVPLVLLNRRRRGSVGYNPAGLFALNEPGIWLDPSDLTTMFQDRAGTIPVTTPGQSVGYRRDKSGRNNHAVANSDAARGIYGIEPLGGRRNLLEWTEDFFNAYWTKTASTVSGDTLTENTTTAEHRLLRSITAVIGAQYTLSFDVRAGSGSRNLYAYQLNGSNGWSVLVNPTTGAILSSAVIGTATGSASVTTLTDGWFRVSIVLTMSSTSLALSIGMADGTNGVYLGNGTSTVRVRNAQFETGSTATAYQRVVDQYNVTEAGKQTLHYVQYDGSDDGYVTPTITPGTDKVQAFAGVRKLSTSTAVILETSAISPSNAGSVGLFGPDSANQYTMLTRGTTTALAATTSASFAAPITNVLTGTGDIAGDVSRLRVNGSQVAETLTDQGTGNYLAYPLYIGRRAGTSLPFNGRDYGLVVRFGATLDASTIAATESWLNQKTGAF